MTAATPRSCRTPQAAATSPKARWRVRSGRIAASRASSSASISAALPRYRSEIILGLPFTQPISRRYQYGFPLITFLYRLAITLGHRLFAGHKQGDTPGCRRPEAIGGERQPIKIEIARKLGLVQQTARLPAGRSHLGDPLGVPRLNALDVLGVDRQVLRGDESQFAGLRHGRPPRGLRVTS